MNKQLLDFAEYLRSKDIYSWDNYCNCGGYASSMNGRNPEHPHLSWCPQYEEWEKEWKLFEACKIKENNF